MRELSRRRFAVPLWAPKREGWWLLAFALVAGVVCVTEALFDIAQLFPAAGVTAIVLTVPFVATWAVLLRLPQLWARISRSGAVAASLWGALVATGVIALRANEAIIAMLAQYGGFTFAFDWGAAIAAPLTEETGKALAIVVILLASRERLRTPMDAALIAGFSGLGFAAMEDVFYAFSTAIRNLGENEFVSTLVLYFLRTGLFATVSHTLFSAAVGAGIGFLVMPGRRRRVGLGLAFLALGYGLHFLWNSPLLGELWLRFLVVGAIPWVVWLAIHRLRKAEIEWFRAVMADEPSRGIVPAAYIASLGRSWWARRKYRNAVVARFGHAAAQPQRALEAELTDLADAIASGDDGAAADFRVRIGRRLAGAGA